jgi:hypothetical protein
LKKLVFFFTFIALTSCNYLDKKVPSEQELLTKQLQQINWNEVDEYPSFNECETLEDKFQQKQCFFEFLTSTIQEKLSIDTLSILFPELDTIEVKVTVFPNSTLLFEPQFPKDSVAYDVVKIDSILHARLVEFPKVNPATKRGIPVKTQFILPVIIQTEK